MKARKTKRRFESVVPYPEGFAFSPPELSKMVEGPMGCYDCCGLTEYSGSEWTREDEMFTYLLVQLRPQADHDSLSWSVSLTVWDGDDWHASLRLPLTGANWRRLYAIYQDLCIPEMITYDELSQLGFEF